MKVKLVNANGEQYLLPETLSVQGWPEETVLPAVEIQGRSGEVIDEPLVCMRARDIIVSGVLEADDKDHADTIREEIAAFCSLANPLKLFRHENADRYMLVYKRGINHAYITGRYGGRVFTLSLEFRAADPFFYATAIRNVSQQVSSTPATQKWSVEQPGTVESQQPIIYIKARSGNLVKPSLKINGIEALLDDTLPSSRALVLHSERRLALETDGSLAWYLEKWGIVGADEAGKATAPTTEESVIGKMDGDWPIYGAPLAPDDNEVIYSDDAASSHNADVSIVWRPKYY